jgi:DNA polymerase bacteriophage-type
LKFCFNDTETRSRTDIGLGNDLYTRDARCMIVTYNFSEVSVDGRWLDQPTRIWEPWCDPTVPADFQNAVNDPNIIFVAHNASFDMKIYLRALRIRIALRRWMCTRAMAYSAGLPGSLDMLGKVVGLPEDQQKLVEDGKLIDTFCIPQGATGQFIEPWEKPDEWKRFCNYAIRDTDTLREIFKRLPTVNYSGNNLRAWHLDQLVNERGFDFDSRLATAAVDFLADAKVKSDGIVSEKSAGEVHAATQRDKLLAYLRRKCGIDIASLRASEVREWLEHDDLDPIVRVLLEQRLEAGKSSGSKYKRGLQMVGPRNRQRNTIQFNGAGRTGRHSGRGFQPHNMARPAILVRRSDGRLILSPVKASYIDEVVIPGIYSKGALDCDIVFGGPNEAAALALRHVITAAPGNELVVGDFKNIESVITAWIAGETIEINAFADAFANPKDKSKDPYRIQWSQFFGTPVADVNDTERQGGKVSKLAFGFGGGVGALVTMAAGYQMDLEPLADIILPKATEEQKAKAYKAWRRAFLRGEDFDLEPRVYQACDILKQVYRTTNSAIDQMRKDVDNAIKNAIKAPMGAVYNVARCKIWSSGSCLNIELPSGRRLLYWFPKVEKETILDPEGGEPWYTEYVSYCTARGKSWRRERAWSGLFIENIVQAIANDVLRAAMLRLHDDTWTVPAIRDYLMTLPEEERTAICLHVHDEVALDVPKGSYPEERMLRVLIYKEKWMEGLPMSADIWIHFRYGKR